MFPFPELSHTRIQAILGFEPDIPVDDAIELARKRLARKEIDGVEVRGVRDRPLSFLADFKTLTYLRITDCDRASADDFSGLEQLTQLRLGGEPKHRVDLSRFPRLEALIIGWHKQTTGLSALTSLKWLHLWSLDQSHKDLRDLGIPPSVIELQLVRAGIKSLRGLEGLPQLKKLDVSMGRNLSTLAAIGSCPRLAKVNLAHVPRARDYEALAASESLRELCVENCAPIPTLRWLKSMKGLEALAILDTKVADKDLSPITKLPRLQHFGGTDSPGYKPRARDIERLVEDRRGAP